MGNDIERTNGGTRGANSTNHKQWPDFSDKIWA